MNSTYIQLWKERALEYACKPALVDDAGSLTYAQTDRLTDALALRLSKWPAAISVAVYTPHSKDIMLGAVAILKAGDVFVPMDDAYPQDRLQYMLEDCRVQAVITVRSLWEQKPLQMEVDKVIFADDFFPETGETFDISACISTPQPADPAFILYTSGTTGHPKGVIHTQRSLISMIQWPLQYIPVPMTAASCCGIVSGYTFIASSLMLFATMATGGTLVFANEQQRTDMRELHSLISHYQISHIFLSGSLATAMIESYDMTGTLMIAGGEKLRNFKPKGGGQILNAYGSTEGVAVCSALIRGDEQEIPIGKPTPDVIIRIVDEEGSEVKQGETGELTYAANFMASGYLNLPEQTAAKFRKDGEGKVFYSSGDRAKQDASGNLYCLGRTDNMVKIRGYRVETGEVENQITACLTSEGIQHAQQSYNVAVVAKNINGSDKLCCYYESDDALSEEQLNSLKTQLALRLAHYMLPDLYISVAQFPRNANGKIMRQALPEPEWKRKTYLSPMTELEQRVADAVNVLLELKEPISMDESFLDLGGDSLRAMRLSQMLSEQGIAVGASVILRLKIIREIAKAAEVDYSRLWTTEQWQMVQDQYVARGEKIERVLPLTPEQDDNLLRQILHPESSQFQKVYVFDTQEVISHAETDAALAQLAQKYEWLRADFVYQGVTPFQIVITDRIHNLQVKAYKPVSSADFRLIITVYDIGQGLSSIRHCLTDFFAILADSHPSDASLEEWHNLLEMAAESGAKTDSAFADDGHEKGKKTDGKSVDISVYSDDPNLPPMTFVHTANTGSEAYYLLADKIGFHCSFSVINAWNIFHPEEPVYGIKNIAAKYIELLREKQPHGPYRLGGWCYGGIITYEMACQLQAAGEEVLSLVLWDSDFMGTPELLQLSEASFAETDRSYFETCPLFEEMRQKGMLKRLIQNYEHVGYDVSHYQPSHFDGPVLYFKPEVLPADAGVAGRRLQEKMLSFKAGNLENYVIHPDQIQVVTVPHEHDLMMGETCVQIAVPYILSLLKKTSQMTDNQVEKTLEFSSIKGKTTDIIGQILDVCQGRKDYWLRLVIEELTDNIVSYAYTDNGPLTVRVKCNRERATIDFLDKGIPYNPLLLPDPNAKETLRERKMGGWGIYLARQRAELHYEYHGMNHLTAIYRFNTEK